MLVHFRWTTWTYIPKYKTLPSHCYEIENYNKVFFMCNLLITEINYMLNVLFFIAISQRDYKMYYVHLAQRKYQIMEEIMKFFKEKVKGIFPLPDCK
jgi:hypothetical protein